MSAAKKLIFLVGLAAIGALIWKLEPGQVLALLRQVGWGFLLILSQEIIAHALNALGWHFALPPGAARETGLGRLLLYRVIGDGVNYLTPSATIAGEFARASLVAPRQPAPVRVGGVVVAKCSQSLAQALFALFGLALFLRGRIPALAPLEPALRALAILCAAGLAAMAGWELAQSRRAWPAPSTVSGLGPRAMWRMLEGFFRRHPGRLAASLVCFTLGFAWGGFEVYLGCRLLGLEISWSTAMAVEVLSCVIDGIFFIVPAKMGTQEGGKTAIFKLLGLPPAAGLAFGIVRHLREFAWAGAGLALYGRALRAERGRPKSGPPRLAEA